MTKRHILSLITAICTLSLFSCGSHTDDSSKNSIDKEKPEVSPVSSISKGDETQDIISSSECISQLCFGGGHNAVITSDNTLYMWGDNNFGSVGNGSDERYILQPEKIMDNVKKVSLGWNHSAALTNNGELYTWGYNEEGQLGDGTLTSSKSPIKIMEDVKDIGMTGQYSTAITNDNSLYLWGGFFMFNNYYEPTKVLDNVKCVITGYYNTIAVITTSDELWLIDHDNFGKTDVSEVIIEKYLENVKQVSLGDFHGAAITYSGELYTWGTNEDGQLGDGTFDDCNYLYNNPPRKIMDNIAYVSLEGNHSSAVSNDGELYIWGDIYGKLTDLKKGECNVPVKVMDNVKSVSNGWYVISVVTNDDRLYMWGNNQDGAIATVPRTDEIILEPIDIMDNIGSAYTNGGYSGVITTNGELYMWGENSEGYLGDGSREDSSIPLKIEISSN